MTIDKSRSNRIVFIAAAVLVPCAIGLTLALSRHPSGQLVTRAVGALGIGAGLFLLAARSLFKPRNGVPTREQLQAEQLAVLRMRFMGATNLLLGLAQFVPDSNARMALTLAAVAVGTASVFKVPRRLFVAR